jgi:hypothetical protein
MSVIKFLKLSAQSPQGYEDAIKQAVERAGEQEERFSLTGIFRANFQPTVPLNVIASSCFFRSLKN